ncbi:MAG: Maf family protein [Rubrivivax sp.]
MEAVDIRELVPLGVLQHAARLEHWLAEDARSTRAFLKRVHAVQPLSLPLQAIDIRELPKPRKGGKATAMQDATDFDALLAPALAGHELGLISEAGLAAVADPGAAVVAAAHARSIPVCVLPGASALLLALAGSGLNGQSFAFVGYLPQDSVARQQRIKELEAVSMRLGQTQLLIETPYRNAAMLQSLVQFRRLDDAEIESYLVAERPYDCAGSAKSETRGIALLESIESDDPTALIGLPLMRTCQLLRAAGIDPLLSGARGTDTFT